MPKIYTRTGDTGETGLFGGTRVRKDETRIEAIGAVDELNAALGLVRAELARAGTAPADVDGLLLRVQHELFNLGAELATVAAVGSGAAMLTDSHVAALEVAIDEHEATLEPLKEFILPGGAPSAAALHVARGVCRRAERRLVTLATTEQVRIELLRYVNRLSDLLFVLARSVNRAHRVGDVVWRQSDVNDSDDNVHSSTQNLNPR
jgi:cob(I)alamin adenosyltransferase